MLQPHQHTTGEHRNFYRIAAQMDEHPDRPQTDKKPSSDDSAHLMDHLRTHPEDAGIGRISLPASTVRHYLIHLANDEENPNDPNDPTDADISTLMGATDQHMGNMLHELIQAGFVNYGTDTQEEPPENEHESLTTIWQVASLLEDGATSEQIEVNLGLRIHEVEAILEHLAIHTDSKSQTQNRPTPKERAVLHFIRHHAESNTSPRSNPSTQEIQEGCGMETLAEAEELTQRLMQKRYILPIEDATPGDWYNTPSRGPNQDEHGVISPSEWEGPMSSLVARLLERQPETEEQTEMRDNILYMVMREDTLRILMDSQVILDLNQTGMDPGWQPPEYSPGWPHRYPVYIEISPPLTQESTGLDGEMHGLIITEDTGKDMRAVLIPVTRNGWVGVKAMTINPTTWEPGTLDGDEDDGDHIGHFLLLFTQLATFLSDHKNEIIPRPLTRSQQRRLARTGRPNPWHIISPDGPKDAPAGE